MEHIISPDQKLFFQEKGYVVIENIISIDEVKQYRIIYDKFLNGQIDVKSNRSDLGDGLGQAKGTENITQIMWPSKFIPKLIEMVYHQKACAISKALLGEDMEMDFDMLINKAPGTNTITPWHQDVAYWPDLHDSRAVSSWLALDRSCLDNGCMWFVPESHLQPMRKHRYAAKEGGALICDANESEGIPIELKPGSCTFHDGKTLHYSRGNSTASQRRALIINFRPQKMIQLEREQGFNHGRNDSSTSILRNNSC